MKPENEEKVTGLLENAYRELKEGKATSLLCLPQQTLSGGYALVRPLGIGHGGDIQRGGRLSGPEGRSGIEAAIPIAIIAAGLSSGFKRKNALGEKSSSSLSGPVAA